MDESKWTELKPAVLELLPNNLSKISFSLPGLPDCTNAMSRKHWAVRMREVKEWHELVHLVLAAVKPSKPWPKAHLTLIRYSSTCPDSDGLVGSFKHVIDGIVHAGILENDSFKHIGMPTYLWEKAKHRPEYRISVVIEELSA